jgi:hypothetical protein
MGLGVRLDGDAGNVGEGFDLLRVELGGESSDRVMIGEIEREAVFRRESPCERGRSRGVRGEATIYPRVAAPPFPGQSGQAFAVSVPWNPAISEVARTNTNKSRDARFMIVPHPIHKLRLAKLLPVDQLSNFLWDIVTHHLIVAQDQ